MGSASSSSESVGDAANIFLRSATIQLESDPSDKPAENVSGGSGDEISQRRRLITRFWVNSEQAGHLETVGQEDQIPMTLDTPKISELVVLKAEILLGIPEKRLYVPPLGICLEYPGSFPPDLISSEVGRRTGKLFVVIADQNSDLTDSLEVHRFGKDLIDSIADLHLPKRFPGQGTGKLADCHVSSLDLDVAVGLESGHPMQALALEELDEIFGGKPVVEECALDFKAELQSIFHQFLGQVDFGLKGDPFLPALLFFEVQPEVERMAFPFRVDELRSHDVVSQDVSLLAVIPIDADTFDLLAGLMGEGVVNRQPSLTPQSPLDLEYIDSGIIDLLLLPDPRGEKSVERTGVLGLDENPIDPLYGQVLRDDQTQDVALEMLKSGRSEMGAKRFKSPLKFLGDVSHHGHCALPPLRRHSITAPFRAMQALFSLALNSFTHVSRGILPVRAIVLCKSLVLSSESHKYGATNTAPASLPADSN